jgi:hypothetical protein
MKRRGRPLAAGLLKSQCMASWIEVKVEAFEAIDKRKERTSKKMGYKLATKLSCWMVSMIRVAVVRRRVP